MYTEVSEIPQDKNIVKSTVCPPELWGRKVNEKWWNTRVQVCLSIEHWANLLCCFPPLQLIYSVYYSSALILYLCSTGCTKFALYIPAYTYIRFTSLRAFKMLEVCSRDFDNVALTGLLRHFSLLGGTKEIFLPDLFFSGWILAERTWKNPPGKWIMHLSSSSICCVQFPCRVSSVFWKPQLEMVAK